MRKNIFRNKNAGAIPIAIIVVAIIVIAGLAVFVYSGTSTEYWETEAEFGMWQEEVIIEYADGTEKSFKIIQEDMSNPLAVYHEGKAISGVRIHLSAQATGTGFTGAEIDCQSFGYEYEIWRSYPPVKLKTGGGGATNNNFNVPMGTTKQLFQGTYLTSNMENDADTFPTGAYIIRLKPKGVVKYRGYPDDPDDWRTVSNPPSRDVIVAVARPVTGSVLVTLTSSTSTY